MSRDPPAAPGSRDRRPGAPPLARGRDGASPRRAAGPTPPKRARITVHHFRVWEAQRGYFIVAPLKGTEARIKRLSGKIIPGTAEEVDAAHVDPQGRYQPPGPPGVR